MEWFVYVAVTLGLSLLWFTSTFVANTLSALENRRITLLIAHPDDEAMFFAPTVLALTRPELRNHVNILCLSSGNAKGLGHIRSEELVKSGLLLGLASASDITVIDNAQHFPDSMTARWPADEISALLGEHIAATRTDTLITFDQLGISSHPNHKSLHRGALLFAQQQTQQQQTQTQQRHLAVYALTSTNAVRKYASILDAPLTILQTLLARLRSGVDEGSRKMGLRRLVFVSGAKEYAQARRAMTQAHRSQMVWFRYGWIGLSRYMVVNDLVLVDGLKGRC